MRVFFAALIGAFVLATAAAQQPVAPAALQLRQEAETLGGMDQMVGDPEGLVPAALAARIRAEIARTSAETAPRTWGSLQLSLAITDTSRAALGDETDAAAATRALDAALSVLTRETAPYDWARAQQLRSYSVRDMMGDAPPDAAQLRARDAAADAAVTVFTKADYPMRYLQVQCMRMYVTTFLPYVGQEATPSERDLKKYEAISPACPQTFLFGAGADEAGLLKSMERTNPLAMLMSAAAMETPITAGQPAVRRGPFGGGRAARLNQQMQDRQADAMAASRAMTAQLVSGAQMVDMIAGNRAAFLSATLAMDSLTLPPEKLRRARAFRAQADALAAQTPRGAPVREDAPMWRPYAEMFDILIEAAPPPAAVTDIGEPVVSLFMMDPTHGAAASKSATGRGVIATTPGLNDDLMRRMYGSYWDDIRSPSQSVRLRATRRGPPVAADSNETMLKVMQDFSANNAAKDWMRMYAAGNFQAAVDDFRTRFEPGWSPAIRKAIAGADVAPGGRVVILPDGASSMLPVGLLRDAATGRSLIEDYEIVYAPSLEVFTVAQRRAAATRQRTLAAYAPTETESGLAYVSAEVAMARGAFGGGANALSPSAGKTDVLAALRGASYWHFATHGAFDAANPRQSWLLLGGGQKLTLNDLFRADEAMGAPRLVVLSACETGIFDATRDPNEFIGLPTGFIQAGAAGVIASLWQVSDVSATLLMAKFYELHLQGGLAPSRALRQAQLWLKDADKSALLTFVQAQNAKGALDAAQTRDLSDAVREADGTKPYAHPYHWGAFVYYGA